MTLEGGKKRSVVARRGETWSSFCKLSVLSETKILEEGLFLAAPAKEEDMRSAR